jgi:hypothetical protein
VFGAIQSGFMSLIVSGLATYKAIGSTPDFMVRWLGAWMFAWPVALAVLLIVTPFVAGVVSRIVAPDEPIARPMPLNVNDRSGA